MLQEEIRQGASQKSAADREADEIQIFVHTRIMPDDIIELTENFYQNLNRCDKKKLCKQIRERDCGGEGQGITEQSDEEGGADNTCINQIKQDAPPHGLDIGNEGKYHEKIPVIFFVFIKE
jgi:hypothetical protein